MVTIRQIDVTDTYRLRRSVLRSNTVSNEIVFDGDDEGVHFGALDDTSVVGIASWIPIDAAEAPTRRTYQLRGMAVAPDQQGHGIGSALLTAGIDHLRSHGVEVVVANARTGALAFYLDHGWTTIGNEYLDEATTGLPHQRIVIELTPATSGNHPDALTDE